MKAAYPIAAGAVLSAAFGLELLAVPTGIWRDEATSYFESSLPHLSDVLARVRISELNPPLFFLLLHGWISAFGGSPEAMKLLPLAWSAGALAFAFLIARMAMDREGALLGTAFVGATSLTAHYASEIRPYATATFFVLAATYAIARWYASGRGRGGIALALGACATVALAYATYIGALFAFALVLVALSIPRPNVERLRFAAIAIVAPLAAAIPAAFLERAQAAIDPYPAVVKLSHEPLAFLLRAAQALPFTLPSPPRLVQPALGVATAFVLALVLLRSLRASYGSPHDARAFLGFLTSSVFLSVAVAETALGLDATRYIVPVLPLGSLALAIGMWRFLRARRDVAPDATAGAITYRVSIGIVSCAVFLAAFGYLESDAQVPKSGVPGVASEYPARANPHLAILVAPDESAQTLAYYEGTIANLHGFYRWDRPDVYDLRGLAALIADPAVVDRAMAHIAALPHMGITELLIVQINAPTNPVRRGAGVEYPAIEDLLRRVEARYTYLRRSDYTASNGEAASAFLFALRPGPGS
jgi:hypothetical protein